MDSNISKGARFEPTIGSHGAVVINDLTLADAAVVREAGNWTTGRRGEQCESAAPFQGQPLSRFIHQNSASRSRLSALLRYS